MVRFDGKQKALALVGGFLVLTVVGYVGFIVFPRATNQGYDPQQPIPFSHKIHAGVNKINCNYCHTGVEKSRHATIPALNVCMNCHTVVKADSPHIKRLKDHYDKGQPVEWIRVHELPDFVYFPHNRHIAKGVSCESCHGDVKNMDQVYQAQPLTMGWCLDCHRGKTTPSAILTATHPDVKDPRGLEVAPISCSTCHY